MTGLRAKTLIGASIGLIVVAFPAVYVLTAVWPGGFQGYVAALALYWLAFCLPLILASQDRDTIRRRLKPRQSLIWGAFAVVIFVMTVAASAAVGSEGGPAWTATAVALGLTMALINAPLEEFAWRGAYLSAGGAPLQALGVVLFALWHVPLLLSTVWSDVAISIAIPIAVAGSFGLGLSWSIMAFWSRSLFWPVVSHVSVNIPSLIALSAANLPG